MTMIVDDAGEPLRSRSSKSRPARMDICIAVKNAGPTIRRRVAGFGGTPRTVAVGAVPGPDPGGGVAGVIVTGRAADVLFLEIDITA